MKRKLIIYGLLLLVILGIGIMALPFLLPQDSIKSRIIAQLEQTTGRAAQINGDLEWRLLPNLQVKIAKLALANAKWAQRDSMILLDRIEVKIDLWALLGGRINIRKLDIEKLQVFLEITPEGTGNWQFAAKEKSAAPKPAQEDRWAISLQNVEIRDSRILIEDYQFGAREEIAALNLRAPQLSPDAPVEIRADFTANGAPAQIRADIANPRAIWGNGASEVKITMNGGQNNIEIDGIFDFVATPKIDLAVDLSFMQIAPTYRRLLASIVTKTTSPVLGRHIGKITTITAKGNLKQGGGENSGGITAKIIYQDKPFSLGVNLAPAEDGQFAANANLRGGGLDVAWQGQGKIAPQDAQQSEFTVKYTLKIQSLRDLAKIFAAKPDAFPALHSINLSGDGQYSEAKQRFSLMGPVFIDKQKISLTISGDGEKLVSGDGAIKGKLETGQTTFEFTSQFVRDQQNIAADIALKTPALEEIFALLGKFAIAVPDPPAAIAAMAVAAQMQIKAQKNDLTIKSLMLDFAGSRTTGELQVKMAENRPKINGDLQIINLDIDQFLAVEKPAPAQSESDAVWDETILDFSPLQRFDADISLIFQNAKMANLQFDHIDGKIEANRGKWNINLEKIALYGGQAMILTRLDVSKKPLQIEKEVVLDDIALRPLLKDAADFSDLEGNFSFTGGFRSEGETQRELITALSGKGNFEAKDGAIYGINIPALLRDLLNIFAQKEQTEQKTDFSHAGGSYVINQGVLRNDDFQLIGPLLRIPGAGQVDLTQRKINYLVTPRLVKSLTGQGGDVNQAGLAIPVLITGPWDNISIVPDFSAMTPDFLNLIGGENRLTQILKGGVVSTTKGVTKGIIYVPKKLGQTLGKVLGAPEPKAKPAEEKPKKNGLENKAREVIKNLFE